MKERTWGLLNYQRVVLNFVRFMLRNLLNEAHSMCDRNMLLDCDLNTSPVIIGILHHLIIFKINIKNGFEILCHVVI